MPPHFIAALVEGSIPLLCGLYSTLLAYRVFGKKPGQDPRWDKWHQRFGGYMKVLGPLMMAFGVFMFFHDLAMPPWPPPDWQRHTLADGACSAEFPAPPQTETHQPAGQPARGLELTRDGGKLYYLLRESELPTTVADGEEEKTLDWLRDNIAAAGKQNGHLEVVRERPVTLDGTHGRELECVGGGGATVKTVLFVRGAMAYQILTTTSQARNDDEEPRKFRESFRFELPKK
ncbi:MAG TPA: hypothetical protein VMS17_01480 [Gemmataceae bacterium]|nr:hypothetical protein [Gemmataceae bacterium]